MGRKKKFTASVFKKSLDAYFNSITVDRTFEDIKTKSGEIYRVTEYLRPPTVTDICLSLHISRQTWARYAKGNVDGITDEERETMIDAAEDARLRCENYLRQELLTRQKGVEGVKFALANDYDFREKHEIGMNGETRRAMAASNMTLEEKAQVLSELEQLFEQEKRDGEDGNTGEDDGEDGE